ncbi:MAG TPA: serine hydrolase [Chitinophagaceae bacterium]|nr:serine hydrolase [Chitinophagaceae bacterium]
MTIKKTSFVTALLFLFLSLQLFSQALLRSTPEAQGVSSKGIVDFLDAIAQSKNEMHSIMIIRHGKVIAEGWWNPYRPDLKHTLYSLSKSFTSTAVGFAVAEKKFSVNDKVISFFPDKLPGTISNNLRELKIKDLITMSAGQFPEPQGITSFNDDWVKGFLSTPIVNEPGSVFLYNSLATYMLSAIVQKVTGQKVIDYLAPRLFKPLGIQGVDWEIDPMGINTGGWGLRVKTEDIAKFGQLYLQKGKWNGKQILPASWVEEATTFKIDNAPGMSQERKDSSDWRQGYCYQFWRCRHNAYRGDGAFGQYCIVLPEEDAVIAITSETGNMQDELNLVWKHLLPAMQVDRSALNQNDAVVLKKRLASLKLRLPAEADTSFHKPVVEAKKFKVETNSKNIETISFNEKSRVITLTIKVKGNTYSLNFGDGKWVEGKTTVHGPSLVEAAKNHFVGLPASQIAGAYSWKAPNVLEMQLRYIDSPHTEKMTFYFDGDKISVDMLDSFKPQDKKITLKGEAMK